MPEEHFYAITLKGKNASKIWDLRKDEEDIDILVEDEEDNDIEDEQTLLIKQIVLGDDAVPGETNVLEVTSLTYNDENVKIPIAVLKNGSTNQVSVDITFPHPPVTFTLVEGSGPVHIIGSLLISNEYADWQYSDSEETTNAKTNGEA